MEDARRSEGYAPPAVHAFANVLRHAAALGFRQIETGDPEPSQG